MDLWADTPAAVGFDLHPRIPAEWSAYILCTTTPLSSQPFDGYVPIRQAEVGSSTRTSELMSLYGYPCRSLSIYICGTVKYLHPAGDAFHAITTAAQINCLNKPP